MWVSNDSTQSVEANPNKTTPNLSQQEWVSIQKGISSKNIRYQLGAIQVLKKRPELIDSFREDLLELGKKADPKVKLEVKKILSL
jgi:hypothetical protein